MGKLPCPELEKHLKAQSLLGPKAQKTRIDAGAETGEHPKPHTTICFMAERCTHSKMTKIPCSLVVLDKDLGCKNVLHAGNSWTIETEIENVKMCTSALKTKRLKLHSSKKNVCLFLSFGSCLFKPHLGSV